MPSMFSAGNSMPPSYLWSPTIGWPIIDMWARNWCWRPVTGFSETQRRLASDAIDDRIMRGRVHGFFLLAGFGLAHAVAIGAGGFDEGGFDLALGRIRHALHERPIGLRG